MADTKKYQVKSTGNDLPNLHYDTIVLKTDDKPEEYQAGESYDLTEEQVNRLKEMGAKLSEEKDEDQQDHQSPHITTGG